MTVGSREDILQHLQSLLGNITGLVGCFRNRGDLPNEPDKVPAAILLDGTERLVQTIPVQNRAMMPPAIMGLRPQIFVILRPRDDLTNETLDGIAAAIGPELTYYRDQVLAAIVNEPTLLSLLTPDGQITYEGCDTDMQTGSSIRGQLLMHFEFKYVLFPPR